MSVKSATSSLQINSETKVTKDVSKCDRLSSPHHQIICNFGLIYVRVFKDSAFTAPISFLDVTLHNDNNGFYICFHFKNKNFSSEFLEDLKKHKPTDVTIEEPSEDAKSANTANKENFDIRMMGDQFTLKTTAGMDLGIRLILTLQWLVPQDVAFLMRYYAYCKQPTGFFWQRVFAKDNGNDRDYVSSYTLVSNDTLEIEFSSNHNIIIKFKDNKSAAFAQYQKALGSDTTIKFGTRAGNFDAYSSKDSDDNIWFILQTKLGKIVGVQLALEFLQDRNVQIIYHMIDSLSKDTNVDYEWRLDVNYENKVKPLQTYAKSTAQSDSFEAEQSVAEKLLYSLKCCAHKTEEVLLHIINQGTTPQQRANSNFAKALLPFTGSNVTKSEAKQSTNSASVDASTAVSTTTTSQGSTQSTSSQSSSTGDPKSQQRCVI